MILDKVHIFNFRSIKDIEIKFVPSCKVLVGINEAGKTNILKALSLLHPDHKVAQDDIRQPLPTERGVIREAYINFIFKLEEKESEEIYKKIKDKILPSREEFTLKDRERKYSLKEFCRLRNEALFEVDILAKEKSAKYWGLSKTYKIIDKWKKPSQKCPPNFTIENKNQKKINLSSILLVNEEKYPDIPKEYLEKIDGEYINEIIGEEIIKIINENLPDVIFWQYDEKNLLPPNINLNTFSSNPDICIPLKNMFLLAGIEDITKVINEEKNKGISQFRNLLIRVAHHTTQHFRRVCKEFKGIKFDLSPNGENMDIFVKEKNLWQFSQRSDGFKRFIIFLLLVSARVKAGEFNNILLLVDDADVCLHPSAAEYLRDELIKISQEGNNYVVYSTHSIFMIDSDNIGRHFIVTKQNEQTFIEDANESNIVKEEVLYQALGWSIFKTLPKRNIILEGWTDKKLFKTAIENVPEDYKIPTKWFDEYGICFCGGVKNILHITPILELAKRDCLIISDADKPAKEKQKDYKRQKGYGVWKRYDEISSRIKAVTSEDFIKEKLIKEVIKKIKESHSNLQGDPKFSSSNGVIVTFKEWLKKNDVDSKKTKEILKEFKSLIFDSLHSDKIKDDYYIFLEDLVHLLNQLWNKVIEKVCPSNKKNN